MTTPETSDEELPAFDLSGKSSAKQVVFMPVQYIDNYDSGYLGMAVQLYV